MRHHTKPTVPAEFGRRQLLKGAGLGLAAAGMAPLIAACGASSASSSASLTNLSYQLEWLKITQFSGFFAAENNGYYKKQGLNVNFAAGGPNISASELVGAGRADLGDDDNIVLLQAIDKGLPLVMFAAIFQKTPESCISLASNPINTLQDMVGKTIAIDTAEAAQLVPALKHAGIDPAKVKIIPAGADPTQLVTHQADGYFGFATSQGVDLQLKGVKIVSVSASDLGFGDYADVLFTTKHNLATKKAELVKFLRATIMGYEFAVTDPAAAARLTVDKYGAPGLNLKSETATAHAQIPLINSPKGVLWLDPVTMQQIIDQQLAIKSISRRLTANEVMTTEILDAAYGGKTNLLS